MPVTILVLTANGMSWWAGKETGNKIDWDWIYQTLSSSRSDSQSQKFIIWGSKGYGKFSLDLGYCGKGIKEGSKACLHRAPGRCNISELGRLSSWGPRGSAEGGVPACSCFREPGISKMPGQQLNFLKIRMELHSQWHAAGSWRWFLFVVCEVNPILVTDDLKNKTETPHML